MSEDTIIYFASMVLYFLSGSWLGFMVQNIRWKRKTGKIEEQAEQTIRAEAQEVQRLRECLKVQRQCGIDAGVSYRLLLQEIEKLKALNRDLMVRCGETVEGM